MKYIKFLIIILIFPFSSCINKDEKSVNGLSYGVILDKFHYEAQKSFNAPVVTPSNQYPLLYHNYQSPCSEFNIVYKSQEGAIFVLDNVDFYYSVNIGDSVRVKYHCDIITTRNSKNEIVADTSLKFDKFEKI